MSGRPIPSGSTSNSPSTREREYSKGHPRDRERESRYSGRDRSRSKSPRRERDRDGGRYDRGGQEDPNGRRYGGEYRNPNRDYDRSAPPSGPGGGRGGHDNSYRGRGSYGYEGGGGNRGGRYGGEERDRPLDRRAIEEGRRRREEERARGTVFDDGPNEVDAKPTIPTGPKRGVTAPREASGPNDGSYGSASPYPEDRDSRERDVNVKIEPGEEGEDEEEEEEDAMAAMLGFGGFGSTKNKGVEQNAEGGANVKKQRTWRQYMNRRGGFNRPLDKIK